MKFERAYEEYLWSQAEKLLLRLGADIGTGKRRKQFMLASNCCIFGLHDTGRDVLLNMCLRYLRDHPSDFIVAECAVRVPDSEDAEADVRISPFVELAHQLGVDRSSGTFKDAVQGLVDALRARYAQGGGEQVVLILRGFDNLRFPLGQNPGRLAGFVKQMANIHNDCKSGRPIWVLEGERNLTMWKTKTPISISNTETWRDFDDVSCVFYTAPLSREALASVLQKMGRKCNDAALDDLMRCTFGHPKLIRHYLMDASKVPLVLDEVADSVYRMLVDFHTPGAYVAKSPMTWFDCLLAADAGRRTSKVVEDSLRCYGILDDDGHMPAGLRDVYGSDVHLSASDSNKFFTGTEFPLSDEPKAYPPEYWMRAGRFFIRRDWSEICVPTCDEKRSYGPLWCRRAARRRGGEECSMSENEKGMQKLYLFLRRYYELKQEEKLGAKPLPKGYYQTNQEAQCKASFFYGSVGLKKFYQEQMHSVWGNNSSGARKWGILPDNEVEKK